MNIITTLFKTKIRLVTGFVVLGCALMGLIGNIFIQGTTFNIILISATISITILTIIVNHKVSQLLQIIIFLAVGGITVFLGVESSYIGQIILFAGILLIYSYGFIKSYSYSTILIIIIAITVMQFFSASGNKIDIINTIVVSGLVLFMWTLLKREMTQYIIESKKNDTIHRTGLNALNFLHNLKLSHIYQEIKICQSNLREEKPDIEDTLHWLDKMFEWIDETNQLKETIARAILDNRTTDRQEIDIHKKIDEIIEYAYFNEKVYGKVRVQKNYARPPLLFRGVPYEIYFLFQNTVSNAIEAIMRTGERGILTITTEKSKNEIVIEVADTGPGFPEKNGQVELRSAKKTGGYGIEYVKEITRKYDGKVEFRNNGEGATVTFRLPIKEVKFMKMRILIVDDSKTYLEILKNKIKKKFKHTILLASSSDEAMELVRKQAADKKPVHLAFIDYVMPEDNGIDLAVKLKREFPDILRFAITDHRDTIRTLIESEMFDHLVSKTAEDEGFDNAIMSAMAIWDDRKKGR